MAIDNDKLSDLEANKRNRKVEITELAISKIPFIKYCEIPEEHYIALQEIAKEVLRISKSRNNGNEVAITYDLDSPSLAMQGEHYIAVAFGDENSVDPRSDTASNHIIMSAKGSVVVISHNHPNLSKISLEDAMYLLQYASIKMIVVVTNRGHISYVVKTKKYNRTGAMEIMREAVDRHNHAKNLKEKQDASAYFMKNCYKVGIIYEEH
ncbi:MAG: hypothetical protein IJ733_14580 [Lachnospiraceae bacterium]|nr:hypothetical protein [Lachnospiraceae bacterium]